MKTRWNLLFKVMLTITLLMVMKAGAAFAETGNVDWQNGNITAKAIGIPAAYSVNASQQKATAIRAAQVQAQRNLLETIQGVRIDANTTVESMMLINDTVRTSVNGLLKGSRIIDERPLGDGSWEVTVGIGMFPTAPGQPSLSEPVYRSIVPTIPDPLPQPVHPFTPQLQVPSSVSNYSFGHTGVIIDVTGFALTRSFSPAIYADDGMPVYGARNINADYAISKGMVEYAAPEDWNGLEIGTSRAGRSPLVIKAIGIRDRECDVIITRADADRLLTANQGGSFLQQCKVVFKMSN